MRTLLILIFLLLFLGPFSLVAFAVEWIIGIFQPDRKDHSCLAIVNSAFRTITRLAGVKLTVIGRERIPEDRPVLYVSNHRGFFDVVVAYPLVKGLCGFVAKKEIEKVPSLRVWMRMLYCQFLDRENAREGMNVIKNCVKLIKEKNISVWICPEGTRSHSEEMLPFKEGSFKIAELAGCPVIPVAITHADDVLENHFPWVKATAITIEFGDPIETAGLDRAEKKALPAKTQDIIRDMLQRNN